jgi:hypothetical protein
MSISRGEWRYPSTRAPSRSLARVLAAADSGTAVAGLPTAARDARPAEPVDIVFTIASSPNGAEVLDAHNGRCWARYRSVCGARSPATP